MIDRISLILVIIGALNWGSIGLFKFDIVAWICGGQGSIVARVIYTLVALAGIWCISLFFRENTLLETNDGKRSKLFKKELKIAAAAESAKALFAVALFNADLSDAKPSAKIFKFFDNFVGKTGFFAYILLKGVRTDEVKRRFSRTASRKYRYRERYFALCQSAPQGQKSCRTLSVPQRKDPVVYRLSRKRELLLLRLRGRRRCDNIRAPNGNLDYMEAVKQLADRAGMALPEDGYDDTLAKKRTAVLAANRAAAKFFHSQLFTDRGRHALNYFLDRGLTMETIRHFGLGFAPDDWRALKNHLNEQGFDDILLESANLLRRSDKSGKVSYYDNFRNRVMFPIIDPRGNVIAFGGRVLDDSKPKYINTSDTLVYKKSNGVFALNFAKNGNDGKLIIAEGYMDVIALHQAGFTNAVACLGTALTKEQANLLSRYADEIILSYDADEAGQKATARALGIFGTTGMEIKVLRLTGGKDPDEIIKNTALSASAI